jgi:hypothetical protein
MIDGILVRAILALKHISRHHYTSRSFTVSISLMIDAFNPNIDIVLVTRWITEISIHFPRPMGKLGKLFGTISST